MVGSLISLSLIQSIYDSGLSVFESEFGHGCSDAKIKIKDEKYINQPEKGPSYHTSEFMKRYHQGVTDCVSSKSVK